MYKLLFIITLIICGCGQDAIILSSDGTGEIGVCYHNVYNHMPICIAKYCPNGSTILKDSIEKYPDEPILVKCLSADNKVNQ